jgi:hypothetical protein
MFVIIFDAPSCPSDKTWYINRLRPHSATRSIFIADRLKLTGFRDMLCIRAIESFAFNGLLINLNTGKCSHFSIETTNFVDHELVDRLLLPLFTSTRTVLKRSAEGTFSRTICGLFISQSIRSIRTRPRLTSIGSGQSDSIQDQLEFDLFDLLDQGHQVVKRPPFFSHLSPPSNTLFIEEPV